jgi:hypothetical protein
MSVQTEDKVSTSRVVALVATALFFLWIIYPWLLHGGTDLVWCVLGSFAVVWIVMNLKDRFVMWNTIRQFKKEFNDDAWRSKDKRP